MLIQNVCWLSSENMHRNLRKNMDFCIEDLRTAESCALFCEAIDGF